MSVPANAQVRRTRDNKSHLSGLSELRQFVLYYEDTSKAEALQLDIVRITIKPKLCSWTTPPTTMKTPTSRTGQHQQDEEAYQAQIKQASVSNDDAYQAYLKAFSMKTDAADNQAPEDLFKSAQAITAQLTNVFSNYEPCDSDSDEGDYDDHPLVKLKEDLEQMEESCCADDRLDEIVSIKNQIDTYIESFALTTRDEDQLQALMEKFNPLYTAALKIISEKKSRTV